MEQNPSDDPRPIGDFIEEAADTLGEMPAPPTEEYLDERDTKETIADLESEKADIEGRIDSGDDTYADRRRLDVIKIELIAERSRYGGIEQTDE